MNIIGYSVESPLNIGYGQLRTEPSAPITDVMRVDDGTIDTAILASY
jgi:hypothetical protein